jgi:hypothetical protein
MAASIALGSKGDTASAAPDFGRQAYVAVTDDELVLVKIKTGRWTTKLDEVIVRLPRTDVASAEVGSGVICPLTITAPALGPVPRSGSVPASESDLHFAR